jgi:hypothetical protein
MVNEEKKMSGNEVVTVQVVGGPSAQVHSEGLHLLHIGKRAMNRCAVLVIALAISGCGPNLPDIADARQRFEEKYQSRLADGTLKIVEFRKTDGQQMTVFGVERYALQYEAIVEWPKGRQCSFLQKLNDCVLRQRGERETKTGRVMFEKSEQGWRATK